MSSSFNLNDHIQPLVVAPRDEGILDQREVTIQSYQTTVPFDRASLEAGLSKGWLTPLIRFGVFSQIPGTSGDAFNVVLGLQDDLPIRAYDYDSRRPLWYSWQNAVVDTVNIHYYRDEHGLLRFTTTGGGRRITDDRLHEFNSTFLGIPTNAVTKRHFDLEKLRDLCFKRFADRLYMVRFSDPSAKEYRSIDHALFQSRKYIDPSAERFKEISSDTTVKIESFDSDIEVNTEELAAPIDVRFMIRGLSGSLRLRFPKVAYKNQAKTPESQATVFYRLANAAVSAILDADYYTHQFRTLDDLSVELGLFPDCVDLAPYREVLLQADARSTFFGRLDLGENWPKWGPHLQAIDELLTSETIVADVTKSIEELSVSDPAKAGRLLAVCKEDARKHRLGGLVARILATQLHAVAAESRAPAEEAILAWAIEREQDSWDVDTGSNEIGVFNLRWKVDDFALDILPAILWKVVAVLHNRLKSATIDAGSLLRQFHWCVSAARCIPTHHAKSCAALRLISAGRVPTSVAEASKVLRDPVKDLRSLDEALLEQFGLPPWPYLSVARRNGKVILANEGIGVAFATQAQVGDPRPDQAGTAMAFDLAPGESMALAVAESRRVLDLDFEKLGQKYHLSLPIASSELTTDAENIKMLPVTISKKRLMDQRAYRKRIDPDGIVIGSSTALLLIFEQIHHANLMDELTPVLLLGEPGVGKTHIARLLHNSSNREGKVFKDVNAGGGGGDLNIQRGEWIGYGKGHGINGVDKNGRPGHLVLSEGGTLFIDEFACLSNDLQVIFLSVLEKHSIQKLGGESFTPDVRCIFATNADVEAEVSKGILRRDLLDRIPIWITIPPLRDRRGDVLLLARHFATGHKLSERYMYALLQHQWPGNIRQLRSKLAAAKAKMIANNASEIDLEHADLPEAVVAAVRDLPDDGIRRELWSRASEIARDEGFEAGIGLQRRTSEIVGCSEAQASKMFRELGLSPASSA